MSAQTAAALSRAVPVGALTPLSHRRRPHILAGEITEFVGRGPNGQLIHYYCLAAPSGRILKRERVQAAAASVLPAGLPQFGSTAR